MQNEMKDLAQLRVSLTVGGQRRTPEALSTSTPPRHLLKHCPVLAKWSPTERHFFRYSEKIMGKVLGTFA
mgnify:CR=1 FL=1